MKNFLISLLLVSNMANADSTRTVPADTFQLNVVGNHVNLIAPGVSASYSYAFPSAQAAANACLVNDGAGGGSWLRYGSSNVNSSLVERDGSGNFTATTITAALTGNVTGNLTGDVTGNVSGSAGTVSGTVAVANGGTNGTTATAGFDNLSPLTTKGDVIVESSAHNVRLGVGTNGQLLTSDSTATNGIAWKTPATAGTVTSVSFTDPGGIFSSSGSPITSSGTLAETVAGTSGGIPYFSSSSVLSSSAALPSNAVVVGGGAGVSPAVVSNNATGTNKVLTQVSSGLPAWNLLVSGDIPDNAANTSGNATNVTGIVAIANGGSNGTTAQIGFDNLSPLATKGDLVAYSGTHNVALPIGTNGKLLTADSTKANGFDWEPPATSGTVTSITAGTGLTGGAITSTGTIALSTPVSVGNGGIGASTLTSNGVLYGNGASAVQATSQGTANSLLTANAGAPAFSQTPTVNTSLTVGVNASQTGSLLLANGGTGGQSVTVQNNGVTSAYNFNLPVSAGTSGQPLLSGGGISSPMVFGTLGISAGGTGQTGKAAAFDALQPMTTAGDLIYGGASGTGARLADGTSVQVLHSGATPSWSAVSLTADVSGTLPLGNGGTNATTKSGAFDSLSPMSTAGDLIYGGTSGTGTALAKGTSAQVLHSGTIPSYSAVSLTADISGTLPIGNGGTNVTSVTVVPAATTFAGWDTNKNFSANNILTAYTTTATAGSTTTLTVASSEIQYFTGSTTQTLVLPAVATLVLGQQFQIVNSSSGVVTVQSSGANTIQAMAASSYATFTVIATSGTSAASWSTNYSVNNAGGGTVTSIIAGSGLTGGTITGSGTIALSTPIAAASLPIVTQSARGVVASAGQLLGTNTNDAASAGNVGEIVSINRAQSSAISLSNATSTNIGSTASISLTAGQWQISGAVGFIPAASTTVTQLRAACSATSASLPGNDTASDPSAGEIQIVQNYPAGTVPAADVTVTIPSFQVQLSGTTSFYLVGRPVFGVSTMTGYGYLQAVRIR